MSRCWSLAACMLACSFVVGACGAARGARAAAGAPQVRDGWASRTPHGMFVSVDNNRANPLINTHLFAAQSFSPFQQPAVGIGIRDGRAVT